MVRRSRYSLLLAKQDFKFSCAHFTLFGAHEAELLHGHNYRVRVELGGERLDDLGLLLDVGPIKRDIREACARLDSRTLLPEGSPHLTSRRGEESVDVRFADRQYRLPLADVVFLPVVNVSMEALASFLWEKLAAGWQNLPIEWIAITVEETDGQGCRYEAPLDRGGES